MNVYESWVYKREATLAGVPLGNVGQTCIGGIPLDLRNQVRYLTSRRHTCRALPDSPFQSGEIFDQPVEFEIPPFPDNGAQTDEGARLLGRARISPGLLCYIKAF